MNSTKNSSRSSKLMKFTDLRQLLQERELERKRGRNLPSDFKPNQCEGKKHYLDLSNEEQPKFRVMSGTVSFHNDIDDEWETAPKFKSDMKKFTHDKDTGMWIAADGEIHVDDYTGIIEFFKKEKITTFKKI